MDLKTLLGRMRHKVISLGIFNNVHIASEDAQPFPVESPPNAYIFTQDCRPHPDWPDEVSFYTIDILIVNQSHQGRTGSGAIMGANHVSGSIVGNGLAYLQNEVIKDLGFMKASGASPNFNEGWWRFEGAAPFSYPNQKEGKARLTFSACVATGKT